MPSKNDLVQEAQSLGIDFDGSISKSDLQAKIQIARDNIPTVQPVQSVPDDAPVVGATMRCWNCANQGVKSRLNQNGVCDECGFDVKTVDNYDLDAIRATQKAEAAAKANPLLHAMKG